MKCLILITLNLISINNVFASGSWASRPQTQTEAGTCVDCDRRAFQGNPVAPMDLNFVGSNGKGSLIDAMKHFELFVQNNPECLSKTRFGLISNLSRGTGNNTSQVVYVDKNGKVNFADITDSNGNRVPSSFWAGEGQGVSNECGSNGSPHGFMKIGNADFRPDTDRKDPNTGQMVRSKWPLCGNLNPGFQFNRMALSGLEKGYNDNLSESQPNCPGGKPRYARLHSIEYSSGNTTQGCKGLQLNDWCAWAPKLEGGCVYNFDGYPSPAIKKIMKTKSI